MLYVKQQGQPQEVWWKVWQRNFLGYSLSFKECRIYNLRTQVVGESMHGLYDEHDSTLEKRRIADLEELERTKISNHT